MNALGEASRTMAPLSAPLEAALTAAGNYLLGVTARSRALASSGDMPDEARQYLLEGVQGAIDHLARAAAIISAQIVEGVSDAAS